MDHEKFIEAMRSVSPLSWDELRELSFRAASSHDISGNLHMPLEEMAELQKEVLKSIRYPEKIVGHEVWKDRRTCIAEEIGDVFITLHYLMHQYNISEKDVRRSMTVKLRDFFGG